MLDQLYDAATDPSLWTEAIDAVADLIGAGATNLTRISLGDKSGTGLATRVDPSIIETYFEHFADINPFNTGSPEELSRGWAPTVYLDEEYIDRDLYVRTEFFNDLVRRIKGEWSMVIRLELAEGAVSTIHACRPQAKGRFETSELATARRLQPHLIRAFKLSQRFGEAQGAAEGFRSALEQASSAMLLTDPDGRILHANAAGERLLAAGDGLCAQAGRLSATTPLAAERVMSLIAGAAGRPGSRQGGSMMLPATAGRSTPVGLTVVPVASERPGLFDSGPTVLVTVEPSAKLGPSAATLADLYRLTPAESRVALALFGGLSPREIAASFGVSPNTVRVQLDSVYAKTGVRRQPELVRLLAGSTPPAIR